MKLAELLELLDGAGLKSQYDFVYLPMDIKTRQSIGYASVNFTNSTAALLFRAAMDGFTSWSIPSPKVCAVHWSQTQGFRPPADRAIPVPREARRVSARCGARHLCDICPSSSPMCLAFGLQRLTNLRWERPFDLHS